MFCAAVGPSAAQIITSLDGTGQWGSFPGVPAVCNLERGLAKARIYHNIMCCKPLSAAS